MTMYNKGDYTLRRLLPNEWQAYRDIRLEALKNEPAVFGSNYDREFAFTEDEWRKRLSNHDQAMFILVFHDEVIGITGVLIHHEDREAVKLIASYIRREHRGKGLSTLFYRARLDWAISRGFKKAIVSHRASNTASKAANQKFGFRYTHSAMTKWPDGIEAEEKFYSLKL